MVFFTDPLIYSIKKSLIFALSSKNDALVNRYVNLIVDLLEPNDEVSEDINWECDTEADTAIFLEIISLLKEHQKNFPGIITQFFKNKKVRERLVDLVPYTQSLQNFKTQTKSKEELFQKIQQKQSNKLLFDSSLIYHD